MQSLWQSNPTLLEHSRLETVLHDRHPSLVRDVALLLVLGVAAAVLTSIATTPVRLPGHAIIRGTIPLVFGLSLAPLVSAGSLMSAAAFVYFAIAAAVGALHPPLPAAMGLIALGPALDLATSCIRTRGYHLYLGFAVAGITANLATFATRMTMGPNIFPRHSMGGGFASPALALVSFVVFGAVAGLVCGMAWFRARPRREISP